MVRTSFGHSPRIEDWQFSGAVSIFWRVPRKIRQLITELERAGFEMVPGGKGSHRKLRHARFPGAVILSGKDGDDVHHYQEKQIRNAIREANK
jgi:predicted RNA binding protein YcfA (HicA-like mRNA interferase family)